MDAEQLRGQIQDFLDDEIRSKPEEERTRRDEMLLAHGQAFSDVLLRHRSEAAVQPTPAEESVTSLLKTYNVINREHAMRDADVDAIEHFRNPKGKAK
jgi:hypothetical protein